MTQKFSSIHVFLFLLTFGFFYVMYHVQEFNYGQFDHISSTQVPPVLGEIKEICDLRFVDKINPRDNSVIRYIKRMTDYIKCYNPSPPDGLEITAYLNTTTGIVHVKTKRAKKITCYYSTFERNGDNKLKYSNDTELTPIDEGNQTTFLNHELDMVTMKTDFIQISCGQGFKYGKYKRSFSFPTKAFYATANQNDTYKTNKNVTNSRSLSKQNKQYSVFLIVVESMSRINFRRFLTLTQKAIDAQEKSGKCTFHNLKGLTKHADNSFPNMLTLLTGKNESQIPSRKGPFDSLEFVWKTFNSAGYKTVLSEEVPEVTLFNYIAKGFEHQPTDYYPRPFWMHIRDKSIGWGSDVCYKNRPKFDILLEQGKTFHSQGQNKNVPTFTFLMEIAINHDDFNDLQMLDTYLSRFIKYFNGYEDTIFILMGDHGNRFGSIVQTLIGRTDERMPYFGLFLPKSLNDSFPSLATNLKVNEYRLTTWYDVHSMLQDVAQGNFTPISRNQGNLITLSPWREEIPLTRTCETANIPKSYCVCDQFEPVKLGAKVETEIGQLLVDNINVRLKLFDKLCTKLRLKKVRSMWRTTNKFNDVSQFLEASIEVEPSNGIFRGVFLHTREVTKLRGDITRINAYGNQSSCIKEPSLRPYCYCK